ncbi:MAG: hypothetical protein OQL09_06720 [Gammaproteobacteria bacterium]|nr:hypothetical protein [Gammaproteobacteria bacterium]
MTQFVQIYAHWFIGISIVGFVMGLLLLPVMVTQIPVDYFMHNARHRLIEDSRHPLMRALVMSIKNLLGAVLLLVGIIMLFTPGQGLLTLFVGLMVMNYPGKYRLEGWLIRRPHVLSAINWLREKYKRPPLQLPDKAS